MLSCGRIRTKFLPGANDLVGGKLGTLGATVINLGENEECELPSDNRERAVVLIHGTCIVSWENETFKLGPRRNPFDDPPYAVFVPRDTELLFQATEKTLVGIGSAPAKSKGVATKIGPEDVEVAVRGDGNWSRTVRKICWSDNTEGEMVLAAETCTPSGNWSTIPPHRHQFLIPGEEVPYEEVYFFQFSRPAGFGLTWQFDDEGELDQAFSLRNNDAIYMNGGYHPVACAPGSTLYHLSLMAGPERISRARVHPDYQFLLEESDLQNQYTPDTK